MGTPDASPHALTPGRIGAAAATLFAFAATAPLAVLMTAVPAAYARGGGPLIPPAFVAAAVASAPGFAAEVASAPGFAAEGERVYALGMDAATGRFRSNEAETAVRIETALGVRLTRAPRWSRADWFDQSGVSYDAVGPFAAGRFDQQWRRFSQQILLHLRKAELVPVDVSLFTAEQVEIVELFIARHRLTPRVFTLGR